MKNSNKRPKNLPVAYESGGNNAAITKEEPHNIVSQLKEQEEIIERGLSGLMCADLALKKIKDEKLYNENYATYEEYCQKRWKYTPQYMNRLLRSSTLLETMKKSETIVSVLPKSEAQTNALLKSQDPVFTWVKAQKETGKEQPTAKEIKTSIIGQNENDTIEVEIEEKQDRTTEETVNEVPVIQNLDYVSLLKNIIKAPYEKGEVSGRAQINVEVDDASIARLEHLSEQLDSPKYSIVAQALIFMEKSLELISEDSIPEE